jgi:hypothetical protein
VKIERYRYLLLEKRPVNLVALRFQMARRVEMLLLNHRLTNLELALD